ncbi:hypothetical protein [Nocardia sp. NPDC005366]|uniref:hypothetical protein n=1 Tax=Nocardia sp. NPDC005366 TaxID=3156878 RepID=UPI0033A49510
MSQREQCYMVTPADYGTVEFNLHSTRLHTEPGDVCMNAGPVGTALLNSLH